LTNTKTKFILILDETEVKDQHLRDFFLKLQSYYINIISNPFYVVEEKIESSKFDAKLVELVGKFEIGDHKPKKEKKTEELN
jgi:hypothetical protein